MRLLHLAHTACFGSALSTRLICSGWHVFTFQEVVASVRGIDLLAMEERSVHVVATIHETTVS